MSLKGVFHSIWLLIAYGLEPVHTGAGRSPGLVDLPVIRDEAGYPIIPRSEVKGALKEYCIRSRRCLEKCMEVIKGCEKPRYRCFNPATGRIQCRSAQCIEECLECCCLWGPEPEEGEEGASVIVVGDLLPLLYPTRLDGYSFSRVYVTTPWLLQKLLDNPAVAGCIEHNNIRDLVNQMLEKSLKLEDRKALVYCEENCLKRLVNEKEKKVLLAGIPLELERGFEEGKGQRSLADRLLEKLELQEGKAMEGKEERSIPVIVVNEALGRSIVESLLERRTRVALRLDTRTVREGALWTEEYIPPGTIYVGFVARSRYHNSFCRKLASDRTCCGTPSYKAIESTIDELFADKSKIVPKYLQVGGRYTSGLGILKTALIGDGD